MSMKLKIISIAVALFLALPILGSIMHDMEASQKEAATKAATVAAQKLAKEKRDALEAEFTANRAQLLQQAQQMIDQNQPDAALNSLAKFVQLKDPEVIHLQAQAQTAKQIKTLSDELATKPKVVRAMAIYRELAALQPSNPLWPAMIEEAQPMVAMVKAQQAQTQAVADRQAAVKRLFSPWDGSVHSVEEAVKARLKDPGSYKHIETRYTDFGTGNIKIFTQYRARNSFNALIPESATAEVSPTGELVSFSMN